MRLVPVLAATGNPGRSHCLPVPSCTTARSAAATWVDVAGEITVRVGVSGIECRVPSGSTVASTSRGATYRPPLAITLYADHSWIGVAAWWVPIAEAARSGSVHFSIGGSTPLLSDGFSI